MNTFCRVLICSLSLKASLCAAESWQVNCDSMETQNSRWSCEEHALVSVSEEEVHEFMVGTLIQMVWQAASQQSEGALSDAFKAQLKQQGVPVDVSLDSTPTDLRVNFTYRF